MAEPPKRQIFLVPSEFLIWFCKHINVAWRFGFPGYEFQESVTYEGYTMLDLYPILTEKAHNHSNLYHYTQINSLASILDHHSIRASRLDKVNDSEENKRITSLWDKKVFVICFTYDLKNQDYFFREYGRIRLHFKRESLCFNNAYSDCNLEKKFSCSKNTILDYHSYSSPEDWSVFDQTLADVYYTDNLSKFVLADGNESNAGLIKRRRGVDKDGNFRDWEIEAETRFRITLRPKGAESIPCGIRFVKPQPRFEYVYFPLPQIEDITVSDATSIEESLSIAQMVKDHLDCFANSSVIRYRMK